ncbi:hypothetical protein [Curtobacterium sp. NPDC089185]|uniref:hypothetical protein n=1 Tax=Curtobacterium sp. NPDC089185 TaxID=3154968 RepID=UPI003449F403
MSEHDRQAVLQDALFSLLLPLNSDGASRGANVLASYFLSRGWTLVDGLQEVRFLVTTWTEAAPARPLKQLVIEILRAEFPGERGARYASKYFETLKALTKGSKRWPALELEDARRMLAHTSLIEFLLQQSMSFTQIVRVLQGIENQLQIPWQAAAVASRMAVRSATFSSADIFDVWKDDEREAERLFLDTTGPESSQILASELSLVASGFQLGWLDALLEQVEEPGEQFWPYLQILHYCCAPLVKVDHPPSFLYEFSPRSALLAPYFARFGTHTGNPFLNNAKSVARLDSGWARTRGSAGAASLVLMLNWLENLPFSARRRAAGAIRAWVVRIVSLHSVEVTPVPRPITPLIFNRLLAVVASRPTGTKGILEQRLFDGVCSIVLGRGRRALGLGDSVNASNTTKRKLGDIEFVSIDDRDSIAVEIHGGSLTQPYVDDHLRTISTLLKRRLNDSWAALDDPSVWTVNVLFVAHELKCVLPPSRRVHGVRVTFEALLFSDLLNEGIPEDLHPDDWEELMALSVESLNVPQIGHPVRKRYMELLEEAS